jgi:hypothetical protein
VYDPERAGGAALLLVSYIDNFAPFNAEADKALQVRWLAPGHSPVRIRAYALKARTYYQLDANSGLATEFSWPLEIVRQISLDRRQLGVVGWTPVATRSGEKKLYLPLEISRVGDNSTASGSPRLSVLPGKRLNEIFLTVTLLNADLTPGPTLLNESPLGYGSYPADTRVDIELVHLKIGKPGVYSVRMKPTVLNGPPAPPLDVLVYNARPH